MLIAGAMSMISTAAYAQSAPQPNWTKTCSKSGDNEICNVQYTLVTGQGQLITSVNLLTAKGKVNRRIFQVAVPTGRNIPQGVKMKIDNGSNKDKVSC